jgi:hypothetical protein
MVTKKTAKWIVVFAAAAIALALLIWYFVWAGGKIDTEFVSLEGYKNVAVPEAMAADDADPAALQEFVWSAVLDTAVVKDAAWEDAGVQADRQALIDRILGQYTVAAEAQQMDLAAYLAEQGIEEAAFREQIEASAKEQVKQALIADAIADRMRLVSGSGAYRAELKKLAQAYEYEDLAALEQTAKSTFGEDAYEAELRNIVTAKVVKEWLAAHCTPVAE